MYIACIYSNVEGIYIASSLIICTFGILILLHHIVEVVARHHRLTPVPRSVTNHAFSEGGKKSKS